MLIDELYRIVKEDREREIAKAQRARLVTAKEPAEPERWTWLRDDRPEASRRPTLRTVQPGRAAADPSA